MIKSKQKNKASHLQIITLVIAIGAFLLAMFATYAANVAYQNGSNALYQQKQSRELEKLRFCYNNRLQVCSPEGIEKWNEENPQNTFTS